jgi:hypothetical protein
MDATPIELVNDSTQIPSSEKEEEDLFCRVCHSEAETNRPLFHPCKCAGSIKYVHQVSIRYRKWFYYRDDDDDDLGLPHDLATSVG